MNIRLTLGLWGAAGLVFAGAGCSSDTTETPGQGGEGQSCYANGTCNPGLTCASKLCVSLPDASGAGGSSGKGTGGSGTGGATGGAANSSGGTSTGGVGGASTGGRGTGGAADSGTDGATGDASGKDGGQDAGKDGAAPACDLLAQTGCSTGQKCAWVKTAGPNGGEIRCAPDGTVAVNGACQSGAIGPTTGFDDCKKGGTCIQGACEALCDPAAASGAPHACSAAYACSTYRGFAGAGACDPTCDPLTQKRNWDNAAACGSSNPSAPNRGCYGLPGGNFTCASAGPAANTSDVAIVAPAYTNSCAPGYAPLLTQGWDSPTVPICVAYCEPGPTSQQSPANAAGLTTSAYTCPAMGAGGAHECHYWWWLEDPAKPATAQSNTLGFCIDPSKYKYDPGNTGRPIMVTDPNYPSCAGLSNAASDYGTWGCAPQ